MAWCASSATTCRYRFWPELSQLIRRAHINVHRSMSACPCCMKVDATDWNIRVSNVQEKVQHTRCFRRQHSNCSYIAGGHSAVIWRLFASFRTPDLNLLHQLHPRLRPRASLRKLFSPSSSFRSNSPLLLLFFGARERVVAAHDALTKELNISRTPISKH